MSATKHKSSCSGPVLRSNVACRQLIAQPDRDGSARNYSIAITGYFDGRARVYAWPAEGQAFLLNLTKALRPVGTSSAKRRAQPGLALLSAIVRLSGKCALGPHGASVSIVSSRPAQCLRP